MDKRTICCIEEFNKIFNKPIYSITRIKLLNCLYIEQLKKFRMARARQDFTYIRGAYILVMLEDYDNKINLLKERTWP